MFLLITFFSPQVNIMSAIRDEWLLEQTRKLEARKDATPASTPHSSPFLDPTKSNNSAGSHYDLTGRLLKASR